MKVIFLALFLLLISSAQAISATTDFNTSSTSIQSNEQVHELVGKFYGNGSIEDSTRLNHKDVFVTSENEHKHELSIFTRKRRGGGRGAGAGGGGGRGGEAGGRGGGRGGGGGRRAGAGAGAAAGTGMRGVRGKRRGHHSHNAAPSLFLGTHFWVSKFMLYLSLALTTLFPVH